MMLSTLAPAKVNLYLHITGKRADGYHLLESLVAFTDIGDTITVSPATQLELTVTGPFSHLIPHDESNILIKTVHMLAKSWNLPKGLHIHLEKNIPVGAGLGGGSADAAALMPLLCRYWHKTTTHEELTTLGLPLGADIPIMLQSQPAFMSGIGEIIAPLEGKTCAFPAVILYPHIPVSTLEVYKRSVPHFRPAEYQHGQPAIQGDLLAWLLERHNDLERPASQIEPEIPAIIQRIRSQPGCRLARMSGSGSACFGVFDSQEEAHLAAHHLQILFPDAWIRNTVIGA